MGASIVARDDLDVLVPVAAIQLVLDAEVWELDAAVPVRQVVLVGPRLDLSVGSIRPPVAIGPAAIVFLEPLLVLAAEIDLDSHPQHDIAVRGRAEGVRIRAVRDLSALAIATSA